jgi:hypothetical protein
MEGKMSLILAKFLGLYFLCVGISAVLNPNRFGKIFDTFKQNEGILTLGAIIALIFGALIVSVHNIWVMDWAVIITILGWWAIIKGVGILAFPRFLDLFSFISKRSDSFYRVIGLIYSLFGLFLAYKGWK